MMDHQARHDIERENFWLPLQADHDLAARIARAPRGVAALAWPLLGMARGTLRDPGQPRAGH